MLLLSSLTSSGCVQAKPPTDTSGGLAFVDSIPRMMGLIAYRKGDGTVGIVMSEGLRPLFHPVH